MAVGGALVGGGVVAATSPESLITGMTEQVPAKSANMRRTPDPSAMRSLVETTLMPYVDFRATDCRVKVVTLTAEGLRLYDKVRRRTPCASNC